MGKLSERFERAQFLVIEKEGRRIRSTSLKIARNGQKRLIATMRNRLSGPTTPAWPKKGDFSQTGKLGSRTGRLRRSLRRVGITGTLPIGPTHIAVKFGVEIGRGIPYDVRIHERGGFIRVRRAPRMIFRLIDGTVRSAFMVQIPARLGMNFEFLKESNRTLKEMQRTLGKKPAA